MFGVEFDFIVRDSIEALNLYKQIFDLKVIEASNLSKGLNEVIFSIYNTKFHLLDENPEYNLFAPDSNIQPSFWFNIRVPDIKKTHQAAINLSCIEIQGITDLKDHGLRNSIFKDPFGYVWMLEEKLL